MRHRAWLVTAGSTLLIVLAGRHVDWHAAGAVVTKAALCPLFIAVTLNLLSLAVRAVRWWIFLRAVGARGLSLAMRSVIVGAGLNNVLVANGGEAARVVLVSRAASVAPTTVTATLALDRLFDPLCFVLLLFVATVAFELPPPLAARREFAPMALCVGIVLLVMLALAPRRRVQPPRGRGRVWRQRWCALRSDIQRLSTARRLAGALACSIVVWGLQVATFQFVARATGVAVPVAGSIAAMLLADLGLIFRATPGNVGFFQIAYAAAARQFGVPTEAAIGTALLVQLVQLIPVTLVAVALAPSFLDAPNPVAYRREPRSSSTLPLVRQNSTNAFISPAAH